MKIMAYEPHTIQWKHLQIKILERLLLFCQKVSWKRSLWHLQVFDLEACWEALRSELSDVVVAQVQCFHRNQPSDLASIYSADLIMMPGKHTHTHTTRHQGLQSPATASSDSECMTISKKYDPHFIFSILFPTGRNPPLCPKPPPLSGTRAEYTVQSGLHPLQMCTLRASKQRPAFFKHFQGHLYFFTSPTDTHTICLIDPAGGRGVALWGGFLSTCEDDRMKRCLCDALKAPVTPVRSPHSWDEGQSTSN